MVKKEEHNAAVGGIPENADEDDEEEHEKVESWTNSLINQGSFDASHLKDTPGWQREHPWPSAVPTLDRFIEENAGMQGS